MVLTSTRSNKRKHPKDKTISPRYWHPVTRIFYMKETPHHSKSVSGLPIVQQKILCAMAYLGRNYHLHLPLDQILSWVEVEEPLYKDHIRILCSKGWLVEEKNYLDGTSVLLINPRKLPEVLDFLLCIHTEWKAEIESLTPHFSPFKAFEDLLMAFFNADIIDSCNILPRVCQSLTGLNPKFRCIC